jgi:hypothetical protein
MWPPADVTALPTAQELIDAKLEIETVETQLSDALLALAQAQLRVDEIKKELLERKAWIAPVRYLPFDVLSLIFEFCGEDDWRTTLLISEVSRHWRETVLATPRAWAFLQLNDFKIKHQMIDRFFSRSGHCPLHIYLPSAMVYSAQILSSVENRLQCLSTYFINNYMEGRVFPVLDRLTLRQGYNSLMEISRFNDIQFPSLRHLLCSISLTNSISEISGVIGWNFPPLQTLSLEMTGDLAWLSLLRAVKNTLISLRLHLVQHCRIQNSQINLPVLKSLEIQCWHDERPFWPLDLKTSVLETYLELTRRSVDESLYHRDTQNVRNLRSDRTPTLSSFPLLEILQLDNDESHVFAVFAKLASNGSLCPNLQEVELATYKNIFAEPPGAKLPEANRRRRVPVKLVIRYSPGRDLPYAIKGRPVCRSLAVILRSHRLSSAETECPAMSIKC